MSSTETDYLHIVTQDRISPRRRDLGRVMIWGSAAILFVLIVIQSLDQFSSLDFGFTTWRPTLYAYFFWATCLCWAQVILHGEQGKRRLFILPAVLFVISMVIFPLIFALGIAFSSWNLSSPDGRQFNGFDNAREMWTDPFYWNALKNMVWYILAIIPEYIIAFCLAVLLNAQIKARKFFRVAFLMPLMLSPVAVSWMIGKSMLEIRFGPISRLARTLGWDNPSTPITNEFMPDPRMFALGLTMSKEFDDQITHERLRKYAEENFEPQFFGVNDSQFGFWFNLGEKWPRGQLSALAMCAEVCEPEAWESLFNKPNLTKFYSPSIEGVEFPSVSV